jgi:hypothetical protein
MSRENVEVVCRAIDYEYTGSAAPGFGRAPVVVGLRLSACVASDR